MAMFETSFSKAMKRWPHYTEAESRHAAAVGHVRLRGRIDSFEGNLWIVYVRGGSDRRWHTVIVKGTVLLEAEDAPRDVA